jgi:hypothetical protein
MFLFRAGAFLNQKCNAARRRRRRGQLQLRRFRPLLLEQLQHRILPTVNLVNNFAGLTVATADTTGTPEPPDTVVAAGPTQVMEVVNSSVRVYDKATGKVLSTKLLPTFFDPVGTAFPFDPVVTYDEQAGRFFIAALESNNTTKRSFLDFAVSNTSNATDGFSEMHKLELTEFDSKDNHYWADYPKLGWNADAYVISMNMYSFDLLAAGGKGLAYKGVQVMAIDKPSVVDKNPFTITEVQTDRDASNFTMAAATMHGSAPGDPMWFVEERDPTDVRVVRMDDVLSATPTFVEFIVPVSKYKGPTVATDGTALVGTTDARIINAEARNGYLVATHTIAGVAAPAAVRWYEFQIGSGTPGLYQEGTILPLSGVADWCPAIAINAANDLALSFMQTSATEFISMYVTGRNDGDPLGTMRPPVLVKAGEAGYTTVRTGDYSGISADPDGTNFWAANEYAIPGGFKNWGTWVGNFWIGTKSLTGWTKAPGATWLEHEIHRFVVAGFSAADAGPTAGDYKAAIDWGDGTPLDANSAQITGANGIFEVTGEHLYAQDGSYTITVTIDEPAANLETTASGPTLVAGLSATAVDISAVEGISTGAVEVARFTDLGQPGPAADYSAQIDWGDGVVSVGVIRSNGNGSFSVLGEHTYAEEGPPSVMGGEPFDGPDIGGPPAGSLGNRSVIPSYGIGVQITDVDGSTGHAASTAEVFDASLQATGQVLRAIEGTFAGVLASFVDANPGGTAGEFAAVIDWGDGSTSPGTITGSGPFSVSGAHYFAPPAASHAVTITITDNGGSSASVTDTVTFVTPNDAFVTQLYQDLLGHSPDGSGLAFWSSMLDQSQVTRLQVALVIENSSEFLNSEVQSLYTRFLRRPADQGGLAACTRLLAGGASVESVAALLVGSKEYYQNRGGGTNDGFLDALYHDALSRAVDAGGRASFDQALAKGATPGQVAAAVFASAEYRKNLVDGYYQEFLQRPGDTPGLRAWMSALTASVQDQIVLASFAASDEYFSLVSEPSRLLGPRVKLSATSIDFGHVGLGSSFFAGLKYVTLTNTGAAPLTITKLEIAGPCMGAFDVTGVSGPSVVLPGDKVKITVFFKPTAAGPQSAMLSITDDAWDSPQLVSLTGIGGL